MRVIFADQSFCIQALVILLDRCVYRVIDFAFQRCELQTFHGHLKQWDVYEEAGKWHTSFGGKTTILVPSLSSIFFSLRSSILSKITCTIPIAFGSCARKGNDIKLQRKSTKKGMHVLATYDRKYVNSDQGLNLKNLLSRCQNKGKAVEYAQLTEESRGPPVD